MFSGFIVYSPGSADKHNFEIAENRSKIKRIDQIREEDILHAEMYLPVIQKYTDNRDNSVIPLVLAVMKAESNFKSGAVSRKGALGLMQLMPTTALEEYRKAGMNASLLKLEQNLINQPELNVALGVKYLQTLHDRLEGIENPDKYRTLVIASYNAGIHRVKRAFKCKGFECYKYKANRYSNNYFKRSIKSLPTETRVYLKNVEYYYKLYKKVLIGQKVGGDITT